MYISVSWNEENHYSEGFVVRLYKTDDSPWVANFRPGWTDLKGVYSFAGSNKLLIVASGACYVIDPDQTTALSSFGVGYNCIFKASDNRYVLLDDTGITVVLKNGEHWDSERIGWDGFRALKFENDIISGQAYDVTNEEKRWVEFTYDINSKELFGGCSIPTIFKKHHQKKKPWWKIW